MPSATLSALSPSDEKKKEDTFWLTLCSVWSEFQLAVLLAPDSLGKKTVLLSIEQANRFYHQRDLFAMQQVISQMVEEMKIRLLPLNIKEKASDLLRLLKGEGFFEK
jgi:hypothetical protein